MKKKKLQRVSFDYHIGWSFIDFLNKEGNSINTENGKRLSDGVEFKWIDSPNRNPEQVPNGLWRRLLYRHLKLYNDN